MQKRSHIRELVEKRSRNATRNEALHMTSDARKSVFCCVRSTKSAARRKRNVPTKSARNANKSGGRSASECRRQLRKLKKPGGRRSSEEAVRRKKIASSWVSN